MAVGVMFMVASRPRPARRQAIRGPSPGPPAPALLHTGSGLSARVSQGFGIPHAFSRCVSNGHHPRSRPTPTIKSDSVSGGAPQKQTLR